MLLKTKVKVGNITNLSDARYFAGMGVDYLGFPFSDMSFAHNAKSYEEITAWVAGPKYVIEWSGQHNHEELKIFVKEHNDVLIQVHASLVQEISSENRKLIVAITSEEWNKRKDSLLTHQDAIEYILLSDDDAFPPYQIINEIADHFQLLLGSGVHKETIDSILNYRIDGIALQGSPEERPGLKEYDLSEILEKLELP